MVAPRFCGPPGSSNGGYLAGLLGERRGIPLSVRFHAPSPLDVPLRVSREGETTQLHHGERLLATAHPGHPTVIPPDPPSPAAVAAAAARFPWATTHPFPHCFVCGTARAPGDGLRIHPGEIAPGTVAAVWTPPEDLLDADGAVPAPILWAALDCAGAYSRDLGPRVLGTFSARIERELRGGKPATVLGWAVAREGRKLHAGTAVFDADGARVGFAEAIWIDVPAPGDA